MGWLSKIISQSKPMALPVHPTGDDYIGEGVGLLNATMTDQSAEAERNRYPGLSWLGSGGYGVAYQCSAGHVCKYTNDPGEARAAKYIMAAKPPCTVQIYNVRQVQESPELWMLETEKVRPLDDEEQLVYDIVKMLSRQQTLSAEDEISIRRDYDFDLVKKLHAGFRDMRNCLKEFNLSTVDTHVHNVGWTNDERLVLLDVGFSY